MLRFIIQLFDSDLLLQGNFIWMCKKYQRHINQTWKSIWYILKKNPRINIGSKKSQQNKEKSESAREDRML